ncbi:REP-associated tyrosine transposase [Thioalkalivibrio sulfidiphilus]|uniref:REP-associated tyrosine transposase n=1 Tax=Thioalkalivibrio sulfidiphilus TaxID=1033854 RepID=UPI0009DA1C76|nr:transposase [Thioalkalivibrio sulfidiphilus]
MTGYRRLYIPGGCYFFTVVTQDRSPILTAPAAIHRLREAVRRTMAAHSFQIDAMVILPDHIHAVWRLPDGDQDFPVRWRKIKHFFSIGQAPGLQRKSLARRREKGVWQRRYWEHAIRDELDWRRHVDYVHYNPVKHGYVASPGDWPHSSFAKAVRMGWYPEGWGTSVPVVLKGMRCVGE